MANTNAGPLQVPPPSRWQGDAFDGGWPQQQMRAGGQSGSATGSAPQAVDVDTVNNAWKHVKAVVVDDGKPVDLYDLLMQSGSESIDPMPAGWPALLKPTAPMMGKMPPMVMQRYNARQTVCFCGVFPAIHRAWASVDNSLFLWRYDKWNDVPLEYSNEEQSISAVGLVKPRPNVFHDAVQYVLVVCTTTEIVLLGVCCSAGNSSDPLNELSFVQLPGYSISADNVTMCTVSSTPKGRIFLGGSDGHLYEMLYHSNDGWVQKRFSKRDHSRSLAAYLPSFLPAIWQKPSPLLDIAIDSDRHILYTRHQSSAIQVFDLGAEGKDQSIRQVADMQDFMNHATYAAGGDIFRGRSPADKKGAQVLHLAVVPLSESQKLHVVAVTLDGRRVYMTTTPQLGYGAPSAARPQGLKPLIARQAPPQPALSAARGGTATSKGLEVAVALYHQTLLLLSETAQEGRSKVLVTARDSTIPPLGPAVASGRLSGFREAVSELDMLVPGETCFIHAVSTRSPLTLVGQVSPVDELAAQTVLPPHRFVLVSTAGVLEFEKRRPVDVLHQMLEERSSTKLEQFFKSYGAAEVAAMCFLLVNAPPPDASVNVVQQAKSTLENASLTGVPQMRADMGSENMPPHAGFDMGQALPVAEPDWSGAHKGLCMYVARLLQPIWEGAVVAPSANDPTILSCRLPATTLQAFESRLRSLEGFLREYQQRRRTRTGASRAPSVFDGPTTSGMTFMEQPVSSATGGMHPNKRPRLEEAARQEDQKVGYVRGLVARGAEACFLLRTLSEHHMPRLVSRLDEPIRARLQPLKLRDWVCSHEGESVAAQLISVLVTEHLSASGGIAEDLAASLQSGCPSYFKESDKIFYQASGMLQRAEAAMSGSECESLTREALRLMMQVVPQLAYLRNFSGCVELPLRKAAALDPNDLASASLPENREAREKRFEMCYIHVMQVLKFLINPGSAEGAASTMEREARMNDAERESAKNILLQRAAQADDRCFHEVLYNTLIDLRAAHELLSTDTPYLEQHLRTNGGLPPVPVSGPVGPLTQSQVYNLELLARLYRKREEYGNAASVYEILASRKSGVADQAISLAQREEAYQEAVLQARAHGEVQNVDRLEVKQAIVQLQQRVVEALEAQATALPVRGEQSLEPRKYGKEDPSEQTEAPGLQEGSAARVELHDVVVDLQEAPKELTQLYNDCAVPHRLWALGLEMTALANFDNPAYIRQLWDLYLQQVWEAKRADMGGASLEAKASSAFEACCTSIERLGQQLPSGSSVFAAAHICMRLELAAAGMWPEKGPARPDAGRVASVMLKACRGREEAVMRVYDELLRQAGGEGEGDKLHLPLVRLRLLSSQLYVLQAATQRVRESLPGVTFGPLQGAPRREVSRLVEACQKQGAEAGRLQPRGASEALVQEYNVLKEALQGLLHGR